MFYNEPVAVFLTSNELRAQRLVLGDPAATPLAGGLTRGSVLLVHGGAGARAGAIEALAPATRAVTAVALVGLEDLPAAALEGAGWRLEAVVNVHVPPQRRLEVAASLVEVVDVLVVGEGVVDARWPRFVARLRRRRGVVVVIEDHCRAERHRQLLRAGSLTTLAVVEAGLECAYGVPAKMQVTLARMPLEETGTPATLEVAG
jgi:hypothetical protein